MQNKKIFIKKNLKKNKKINQKIITTLLSITLLLFLLTNSLSNLKIYITFDIEFLINSITISQYIFLGFILIQTTILYKTNKQKLKKIFGNVFLITFIGSLFIILITLLIRPHFTETIINLESTLLPYNYTILNPENSIILKLIPKQLYSDIILLFIITFTIKTIIIGFLLISLKIPKFYKSIQNKLKLNKK
jgi:hypothetical protein